MLRFCILLAAAVSLLGVENPWAKVKDLKTGQEVRVLKRSSRTPVIGAFDELTDDNLIVVVKNQQTAIAREDIDRVDARPLATASRVRRESKSEIKDPAPPCGLPTDARVPGTSTTSAIVVGDKADFETVYRRTAASAGQPK